MTLKLRQDALNALANASLMNTDEPEAWTRDDLVNATLVLNSIAHSLSWTTGHLAGLTLEQRCMIAQEFGKNIRQSVELFTGIDLSDLVLDAEELTE